VYKAVPLHIEHAELESLDAPVDTAGVHDVCFAFATRAHDPFWLVDFVQLMPK
jgi:hypothetical protein